MGCSVGESNLSIPFPLPKALFMGIQSKLHSKQLTKFRVPACFRLLVALETGLKVFYFSLNLIKPQTRRGWAGSVEKKTK